MISCEQCLRTSLSIRCFDSLFSSELFFVVFRTTNHTRFHDEKIVILLIKYVLMFFGHLRTSSQLKQFIVLASFAANLRRLIRSHWGPDQTRPLFPFLMNFNIKRSVNFFRRLMTAIKCLWSCVVHLLPESTLSLSNDGYRANGSLLMTRSPLPLSLNKRQSIFIIVWAAGK